MCSATNFGTTSKKNFFSKKNVLCLFIVCISGLLQTIHSQTLANISLGSRTFTLISNRWNIPGVQNHAVGSYGERIWDLEEFGGKIYIGLGDWAAQSGPRPIVSYRPSTNSFVTERTINSDAIENYKRVSPFLFAPHTDECGSGVGTTDYTQDGVSWTTAPSHDGGMHCFDATYQNGRIYVATGSSAGAQIRSMATGGSSWSMEYQTTGFERFKYIGSDSTTVFVTSEGANRSFAKKDGAWFEVTTSGTNPWPVTANGVMRMIYGTLCMELLGSKLKLTTTIHYVGYQQQASVAQADVVIPYEVVYIISTNNDATKEIYASSDFVNWKPIFTIEDQKTRGAVDAMKSAWCLAYCNNTLYLGMSTGDLYKIGDIYDLTTGMKRPPPTPKFNENIGNFVPGKGLYFAQNKDGMYTLSIYSLDGSKVAEIANANGVCGQNVAALNLCNGMYLAKLLTKTRRLEKKIQVVK